MSKVDIRDSLSTAYWENLRDFIVPMHTIKDLNKLDLGDKLPYGMSIRKVEEHFNLPESDTWKTFYENLNNKVNDIIKDRDIDYTDILKKDDSPSELSFIKAYQYNNPDMNKSESEEKAKRLYEKMMFKDKDEDAVKDYIKEYEDSENELEEER